MVRSFFISCIALVLFTIDCSNFSKAILLAGFLGSIPFLWLQVIAACKFAYFAIYIFFVSDEFVFTSRGGLFNVCFTIFVAINVLKTFAVRPGTFLGSMFLKNVLTFIELMLSKTRS